jgi:cytochrome c oxidase subunit 3
MEAKKNNFTSLKYGLGLTTALGICFLIAQWYGWVSLFENNVFLVGSEAGGVSGSFVYVLSGLHGAHVISAVIYLAVIFVAAARMEIHSKKLTRLEMCMTYWHFLGVLWLYLFGFLLLNR